MSRSLSWAGFTFLVLVGCGGGTTDVSDDAVAGLQPRIAEIRQLATARQPELVTAKLAELRLIVEDLRRQGELTDEGARDVLAAADDVEAQLFLITTTTQPPPPPADDEEDGDDEEEEDDEED